MVCYSSATTDLRPNVSTVYSKSNDSMPVAFSEVLQWCTVWHYIYKEADSAEIAESLYVNKRTVKRKLSLFSNWACCKQGKHW